MADSSALLDALLLETESEDEQLLPGDGVDFAAGTRAGAEAAGKKHLETSATVELIDLTDATASSPAEELAPAARTRGPRKMATRRREREEIERLRAEEDGLRQELNRLRMDKQSRSTVAVDGPGGDRAAQQQQRVSALWYRVAKSQLARRQSSQVENLKLRHMLDHQAKVMQRMQTLLRKRSTLSAEHWMSVRKRQCALTDADAITFARLESELDAQYTETDAVLRDSSSAGSMAELQRAQVKTHATRGMYIEFFDARIMPFRVHDAGNAMWDGLQTAEVALSDGVYNTVSASADALSAKLSIRLSGARPEVLVDAKFVARKFAEESRVVIVWQCQSDTDGELCGDRGVRLLNSGWTVIRGVEDAHASTGVDSEHSPASIIQSIARVMPDLANDPRLKPEDVGVLADLVTSSFLSNMHSHHQITEDILVQRLAT